MDLHEASFLARDLMDYHGLLLWGFGFDRAKRRCGNCNFGKRKITLSRHYTELNSRQEVTDTVLHEIAHAIAGFKAGHGPEWKRVAQRIGAKPQRCADASVEMPKAKWRLMCQEGHDFGPRHRRSKSMDYHICGRCRTGLRYVLN